MSVTNRPANDLVLAEACAVAGLDPSAMDLLHNHATGVYLHRSAGAVLRVSRGKERERARTAVAITRWLRQQDFPATSPLDLPQPIEIEDASITLWRYYPQGDQPAPEPSALGHLLQRLHSLAPPPVDLPRYQPLTRLGVVLGRDSCLSSDEQRDLDGRRDELLAQYESLASELGTGLIHGDAYPGNTLWHGDQPILGDWDEVAIGPRELDLVNTHQGARFGRSQAQLAAFNDAYGWDVGRWSGFPILREMRDLHTLAVFIERATAGDQSAEAELRHRLSTLKLEDKTKAWHSA